MLFTNLKLNVITMPLSYYDTCFLPFLLFYSFVLRMSCNICFFLACFFYFFLLLTLSDTYFFFIFSLFVFFFFRQTVIPFTCLFTQSNFIVFVVFFCLGTNSLFLWQQFKQALFTIIICSEKNIFPLASLILRVSVEKLV